MCLHCNQKGSKFTIGSLRIDILVKFKLEFCFWNKRLCLNYTLGISHHKINSKQKDKIKIKHKTFFILR